jgi:hypothetical protein
VSHPEDAAALDRFSDGVRAALGLIPTHCHGFRGDVWRVRSLWAASEPLRERAVALLGANSPWAMTGCEACNGTGVVEGRPCGLCKGLGWALVE